MRSANATRGLLAASCLLVVGALAACQTTQDEATRLAVRSKRVLAARKPIKLTKVDPSVHVVKTAVVKGAGDTAIALTLRNVGSNPVNDLPLAVGFKTADGGSAYLNNKGHLPYFQAHAPALAPGQETTWVYTSSDKVASAGAPIAKVGVATSPRLTTAQEVPKLDVTRVSSPDPDGAVRATIDNTSGLPQYDLGVYAWALKDGKYVAAGQTSIEHLGTGESDTVKLKLIGDAHGADVHVSAPPTIFQ